MDSSVADFSVVEFLLADAPVADFPVADLSAADFSVVDLSVAEFSVADLSAAGFPVVDVARPSCLACFKDEGPLRGPRISKVFCFRAFSAFLLLPLHTPCPMNIRAI